MPNLHEIEQKLRELLRSEYPSRPLLCSGSPIGCDIAIVGVNPATDIPLWRYWNADTGCNKAAWLAEFRSDPANRKKQTRPRIEYILEEIAPLRCLELNIYPYISREEAELSNELKDVRAFVYLLRTIKPKLLFVFGTTPIKELSKLLKVRDFPKGAYTLCTFEGTRFDVYADSHLSRGWNESRARALGRDFKERIMAGPRLPNGSS